MPSIRGDDAVLDQINSDDESVAEFLRNFERHHANNPHKEIIQTIKSTIRTLERNLKRLKSQLKTLEEEDDEILSTSSHTGDSEDEGGQTLSTNTDLGDFEQPTAKRRKVVETSNHVDETEKNIASISGSNERESNSSRNADLRSRPLSVEEYQRYGRQMMVPGFGLLGQFHLKETRVLLVGLGGLGCPAAAYLAGAGIGRIGMVDGDTVELSNLHRQIIHTRESIGLNKVDSAFKYLSSLNSNPTYDLYRYHLTPETALQIFPKYDLILDCTDHPSSRYLISDASVICGKMLITASATKTEGQLMILGSGRNEWPCYRCVFPKPPPPETIQGCNESGILGPAVGVMGVLMAVQAIKLITQLGDKQNPGRILWLSSREKPTLLLYSAFATTPFRTVNLQGARKDCPACCLYCQAKVTRKSLLSGGTDYKVFCGTSKSEDLLSSEMRISAEDFKSNIKRRVRMAKLDNSLFYLPCRDKDTSNEEGFDADISPCYMLVDVREKQDFDMCHVKGSVNVPFSALENAFSRQELLDANTLEPFRNWRDLLSRNPQCEVYFICRYGNDSQRVVAYFDANRDGLLYHIIFPEKSKVAGDVVGGLRAWSQKIDPGFPVY